MMFRRLSPSGMPPSPNYWDVGKKWGEHGAGNLRVAGGPEAMERIVSFSDKD